MKRFVPGFFDFLEGDLIGREFFKTRLEEARRADVIELALREENGSICGKGGELLRKRLSGIAKFDAPPEGDAAVIENLRAVAVFVRPGLGAALRADAGADSDPRTDAGHKRKGGAHPRLGLPHWIEERGAYPGRRKSMGMVH